MGENSGGDREILSWNQAWGQQSRGQEENILGTLPWSGTELENLPYPQRPGPHCTLSCRIRADCSELGQSAGGSSSSQISLGEGLKACLETPLSLD